MVFHGQMHQVGDWPLESHHASVQSHELRQQCPHPEAASQSLPLCPATSSTR